MPKVIYSEKLLSDIQSGNWRESELDLSNQKPSLDEKAIQQLASALAANPFIKTLDVNTNWLGDVEIAILAQNTTLVSLNLQGNVINDESAKALAQNQTLTWLDLSGSNISAEGAKALAKNQTLTWLKLWGAGIGDEGAKALAQNTTLRFLNLGYEYNRIGNEGAKALAQNTTLTSLNLWQNKIGGEGAKALAKNATLISLIVWGCKIGETGAVALAKNTTLTSLDLGNNNIGAAGVQALAQNTTLTDLNVASNKLGDDAIKSVNEMLSRNKKFRQESLTITIGQVIPVSALVLIILTYSADYHYAPQANQTNALDKAAQNDQAVPLTHFQKQLILEYSDDYAAPKADMGQASALAKIGFFAETSDIKADHNTRLQGSAQCVFAAAAASAAVNPHPAKSKSDGKADERQANHKPAAGAGVAKPVLSKLSRIIG